jgi:Sec-independent protein translocase protein TatA
MESLLKSVQQGLKTLKKEAKKAQNPLALETKKAPAQQKSEPVSKTQPTNSPKPVRQSRRKESSAAGLSSGAKPPIA